MNTEDQAWRELQKHAAAQLRPDFASRVLRAAQGPDVAAWRALRSHAAAQIKPGFAQRVLRAARAFPRAPSLFDQLALSAATAAVCLLGVLFVHERSTQAEEERNIAGWQQIASEVQDSDLDATL